MKVVIAESVAMMAIGDGVLGALFPVQHSTRWEFGPEPWRKCMRMWAEHPELTRAMSLLQIVGGVVLGVASSFNPGEELIRLRRRLPSRPTAAGPLRRDRKQGERSIDWRQWHAIYSFYPFDRVIGELMVRGMRALLVAGALTLGCAAPVGVAI